MSTAIEETVRSPVVEEEKEELQQTPLSPVMEKETATTPKAPQQDQRPPSRDSDKETDTFEDAVESGETGSVRSLTKRQPSVVKPLAVEDEIESDYEEPDSPVAPARQSVLAVDGPADVVEKPESPTTTDDRISRRFSRVSQASAGSLDNVNLDDDSTPTAATQLAKVAASVPAAAATQEVPAAANPEPATAEKPAAVPEKAHTAKTMSFSSISMPWDTRSRSPPAASTAPPSPNPVPVAAPPAPTGRKFNSPFSWLSRSSTKVETPVPPAPSPRRNTASSVATMTSNPEMMLSKLDEDDETRAVGSRNSLKDRFKALRMREEAGIPGVNGEEDKQGSENGDADTVTIPKPPPSPLPQSPSRNLAPGTVSGVNAGPSAMADTPVDWDLWQAVVYEGPAAVARTSAEELNKAIATGIPSAIRGVIWQVLAQSKNEELEIVYRELVVRGTEREINSTTNGSTKDTASSASSVNSETVSTGGGSSPTDKETDSIKSAAAAAERKKKDKEDLAQLQKLEKVIRRDLGARTSYSKYAAAQGLQEGLFGVCKAYALFDEQVGYAQGMNFLIMPLLFNMAEEEAFCLLVRLMNHYQLRDLFVADMPGLHLRLFQFERLLEDLEPALYCHLKRRGITPHLYATQWFLTLFAYRFPLQLVLRIYDLILSEGLSAILRFGIVLMQKNAANLLGITDMSALTTFLKDRLFDFYIDATPSTNSILENGFFGSSSSSLDKEVYRADQLVRDACEVKITPEMLQAYKAEWEEKTRAEREREQELESLRSANASYASRVRRLEERIEAHDREQAELATDLVKTKVENEELKDENESLRGQVKELRIVIEKQPEELEQAWELERGDLMKRNEKVHEENERLEKELKDLEEELVATKVQYAEVCFPLLVYLPPKTKMLTCGDQVNSQHETLKQKWKELKKQFDN
ncbi:putative GTPase-activating protein [Triangularia setosa]|uniref:GTPase-activating protein GYP5 n=1 Tax=Triangularia setosa TaxID=2587417 RepID=A0AAN6W6P4_9PEZI|nr:putative GTPase-activating protein [Podospora setosa]